MNVQLLISDQIAHRVGWCLVHFIWQGALVAPGLAVALALLRRRSANARYLVCFGALLLMAALPFLTYGIQAGSLMQPAPAPAAAAQAALPPVQPVSTAPVTLAAWVPEVISQGPLTGRAGDWIDTVLPWLFIAWLAGVFALALRNAVGWLQMRTLLRRDTVLLDSPWKERFESLRLALRIGRPVRLLESSRAAAPMAAGILAPVVLLPAAVIAGLTPGQVEAILAHELAHIRRHDFLANLIQIAIETLLFYHPAVWWISRRVREERENCCDDLAARACGGALQYARALTSLAEIVTAPTVLAVSATGGLLRRVQRLVGVPEKRALRFAPPIAGIVALFIVSCVGLGSCSGRPGTDLTAKVATLNIDTATREDVIRVFGKPNDYSWDNGQFTEKNLPADYHISFANDVGVWMHNHKVYELRFNRDNYLFRDKIRVGSKLEEVFDALGQPTQTIVGQRNGFYPGVLYKDINGREGYCYYAREDHHVRLWFNKYKVSAIYVTCSGYTDGYRPPNPDGAPNIDLTPVVEKLNIDTATREDLIRAFGKPNDYSWDNGQFTEKNLPADYCISFANDVEVWMHNNKVNELRFNGDNYLFRDKIRVGSKLDEVFEALGQPTQTIVGQRNGFYPGVLYKDIDGREGYCYYAREDHHVRLWFSNYKVSAVYVTCSGYTDGYRPPNPGGAPDMDLTPVVEKFNIDTATKEDVLRAFGTPFYYMQGDNKRLDENDLPSAYHIVFPNELTVSMQDNAVNYLWFTGENFTFRGKIHVGSTLEEVLEALGNPMQTIQGPPRERPYAAGVLYKDIDKYPGLCYYAREEQNVQVWLNHNKVTRLALTRSDYNNGARPLQVSGEPLKDLTPLVDKLNIDTATKEEMIHVFGAPLKYVWAQRRLDPDNLPANYIMMLPDGLDVWMRDNTVNEMRFYDANYLFHGRVRVGSTFDEVLNALGQPTETVTDKPNEFKSGVLYKDIDGRKGSGYYAREDQHVRMFFKDGKVSVVHVTRSNFE